jgi:acyl-CoA synthetase (AMP-forming)/AMP-acid ligase II
MTLIDLWDKGWQANRHGTAYVAGTEVWSFQEARELSCQIANALLAGTDGERLHVAVISANSPRAWISVLGIWRAGHIWLPMNPSSPTHELQSMLDRFDADVVLYSSDHAAQIADLHADLPRVRTWIQLPNHNGNTATNPVTTTNTDVFYNWIAPHTADEPRVESREDDVIVIAPTGGTTGLPKGVMNTNRNLSMYVAHFMLATPYQRRSWPVDLAAAPMTHTAGFQSLAASARGGTVVMLQRAAVEDIIETVEKHGVTDLFLPPTVIYRLLEVLKSRPADLSSLRYLVYGAAPMSLERLKEAIEVLGPVMVEMYGQMEAPGSISFLYADEHLEDGAIAPDSRLLSCGRPSAFVRAAILDDAGNSLPQGKKGEICVKGDLVMAGYYKQPEETAATIVDGWLHTGDIGYLDGNGYLHVVDRKKDLIITGGLNVYPFEVEQVIYRYPGVRDCAVVGLPHADWGESVAAFIETENSESITEAKIIAHCKEQLDSVRAPKAVFFTDALPRSNNGKVLRRKVRENYMRMHN